MTSLYPVVELRDHIEEVRIRAGRPDGGGLQALSVTNTDGLIESDRRTSDDLSSYLCVEEGCFAYNPYRINVGSIGLARGPSQTGLVSPAYVVFRAKSTLVPEYLLFLLRSSEGLAQIERLTSGSVRQTLRFEALCRFKLPLPPLSIQRRIIDILEHADELCHKRGQANHLTDRILRALFVKMFGDPATNPMGWTVVHLGEVIASSRYGTSKANNIKGIGLPVLRMNNITYEGFLDLNDLKHVDLDEKEIERHRLQTGDLLFNRTNSRELVGKTAIFNGEIDCVAASYLIRVRLDKSKARPEYVWGFLNSHYGKQLLFNTARQSVSQANINTQEVRSLELPIPPISEQMRYVKLVRELQDLRQQQAQSRRHLDVTFDALLARTFRGELQIALPIEEVFPGLTKRQHVLLALVSEVNQSDQPVYITPLMKYAFLLKQEGGRIARGDAQLTLPLAAESRAIYLPVEWYEFVPHKYGPFAKEVYDDLETLEEAGLIERDHLERREGALREKTAIYVADDKSEAIRNLVDSLPAEVRQGVEAIIKEYGDLSQRELLDVVYQRYPDYTVNSERYGRKD